MVDDHEELGRVHGHRGEWQGITKVIVLGWSISLLCALGLAVFSERSALRVTGWLLVAGFACLILVAVKLRK